MTVDAKAVVHTATLDKEKGFFICVGCGERNAVPTEGTKDQKGKEQNSVVVKGADEKMQLSGQHRQKKSANAFDCVFCGLANNAEADMAVRDQNKVYIGKFQLARAKYHAVHAWDRCAKITKNSATFCELFMRQNSIVGLEEKIKLVEKIVTVRMTAEERLLYKVSIRFSCLPAVRG